MFKQVLLLCLLVACSCAALLPLGYAGYGGHGSYAGYGAVPLTYARGPAAISSAPLAYSAAAFPSYETVSHTVSVAAEPVEQHGYTVKY